MHTRHIRSIGGFFIYAEDPGRLAAWYERHLGIESRRNPNGSSYYFQFMYRSDADPHRQVSITWAIVPAKRLPLSRDRKAMINYRVTDLTRLLAHLRENGVPIRREAEYDYGRFAWIDDPEGNRIELFEERPAGDI